MCKSVWPGVILETVAALVLIAGMWAGVEVVGAQVAVQRIGIQIAAR